MYNFFCEIEKFWFKQIELNIKETTVIFFIVCINNLLHYCVLFNQNFILIPWVEYLEIWIMKKIFISDPVDWMMKYTNECTKWSGLSLRKPINRDIRDLIKDNLDSLLDFRSYLFSRQCALLFLLNMPLEVPKRAMEFLHNTVQEVRKLKVGLNTGMNKKDQKKVY